MAIVKSKTRKIRRKRVNRTRKLRGGSVNCYNKSKTWSCSAQCDESNPGACKPFD